MAINLTLLRSFHLVVQSGGVSKAARTGYASQAGLSKAVKELEHQLGVSLLERSTRGSVPTAAGKELYEYAKAIFTLESRAEDALRGYKGLSSAHLRVGAGSTIANYILPAVIRDFCEKHRGVKVSLEAANSLEIETDLWNYQFDVALIAGLPHDENLVKVWWGEDELVCIAQAQHVLARRNLVYMNDLEKNQWVSREDGSSARAATDRILKAHGLEVDIRLEVNSWEGQIQAVAAGVGIGFVSRHAVADQVALGRVSILRIAEVELRNPLYLLRLPNRPPAPAAAAFERFLLNRVKSKP